MPHLLSRLRALLTTPAPKCVEPVRLRRPPITIAMVVAANERFMRGERFCRCAHRGLPAPTRQQLEQAGRHAMESLRRELAQKG